MHAWVELRAGAKHHARMEHAVAAGEHTVPENASQFSPFGGDQAPVDRNLDRLPIVAEVRNDGAGAKVDLCTQNRVTYIGQMGGLGAFEEDRMLDLAVGSDNAFIAYPTASSNIGSGTNLDIAADSHWALDNGARMNSRSPTDDYAVAIETRIGIESDLDRFSRQGQEHLLEGLAEKTPGGGCIVPTSELLG